MLVVSVFCVLGMRPRDHLGVDVADDCYEEIGEDQCAEHLRGAVSDRWGVTARARGG